jgi:hypothetical protein
MIDQISFLGIERGYRGLGRFTRIWNKIVFIRVNLLNPPNQRSI